MDQRDSVSLKRNKKKLEGYMLFLMILPFVALCFVFSYLPLVGWRYAFYDYMPGYKLSQSDYVGFHWFQILVSNKTQMSEILRVLNNTFGISGLNILTSVLPVIFAVFLVEITSPRFKKMVQVFTTLPHFISWVLIYSIAYAIFSYNSGVVNKIFISFGMLDKPVNWLASGDHLWLKMCLWNLWKNIGWSAIMYLAAIASIDQEIYEASTVDGAGRFRKMWHITVPGIMPTFFVLLLLAIANFLNNGMEQYYVFQNAVTKQHVEVLDLYVYNIGIGSGTIPIATVVSMLKSIVSLCLLFSVNGLSKMVRGETIV